MLQMTMEAGDGEVLPGAEELRSRAKIKKMKKTGPRSRGMLQTIKLVCVGGGDGGSGSGVPSSLLATNAQG